MYKWVFDVFSQLLLDSCSLTFTVISISRGVPRNRECLPAKAAGTERGRSKGEAVCIAGGRPGSVGLLKPVGDQMTPPKPQMLETEWQGMIFVLLAFCLVLVREFLVLPPSFPLGIGIFNLSHRLMEVCNLLLILPGLIDKTLTWVSGKTMEFWTISKTMRNFEVKLSIYQLWVDHKPCGWNIMVWE